MAFQTFLIRILTRILTEQIRAEIEAGIDRAALEDEARQRVLAEVAASMDEYKAAEFSRRIDAFMQRMDAGDLTPEEEAQVETEMRALLGA